MGYQSRHKCERYSWVESAWTLRNLQPAFAVLHGINRFPLKGAQLSILILISLLGALLLGAVGSVSNAYANSPVIKFDGGDKVQRLSVPVDKSDTIRLEHPFAEALVGDSEIADVIPLTNQSLSVHGKKIGATRLTILGAEKNVLGIVDVDISYDEAGAVGSVSNAYTGPQVVKFDGGNKVKRLRVPVDKSDTIRLEHPFAEALVGDSEIADVIPLTNQSLYVLGKKIGATRLTILGAEKNVLGIVEVEISYDVAGIRAHIYEALPQARVKVKSANGRIVLSGVVPDAPTLARAISIAEQFAPDAVVNSVSLSTSQQVMLEVRFVEATRNAARDLGISSNVLNSNGRFNAVTNFPGSIGLGAFPANRTPFGTVLANLLSNGHTADILVQALEERGLARRLAEPNLIALSGDTASFLAGGEFPFPVGRDNDQISIEFKKFGVGLAFTPTVLADGLINLKIEPEVSEIDPNNTLRVNGTEIPSLITRRTKTTVELRDGQSFAIAGLLQATHSKGIRQLPWIGRVPVLGALMRSASYEKNESELVIIVTPRLVKPAVPGDKLITPFDKSVASNDVDFFVRGKMEGWKTGRRHEKRRRREKAHRGHILDAGNYKGASFGADRTSYKGGV